jgi:hypothetical protein
VLSTGPPLTTLNKEALVEEALAELDPEVVVYVPVVGIAVDACCNACCDAWLLLNSAAIDAATSLGTAEFRTEIAFVVVGIIVLVIVLL